MTDEIRPVLKNLHYADAAMLDDELAHAEKKDLGYQELIARLLRAQYHHRQETALAWRIRRAGLPEQWTLESFPWKRQPGVSQKQIRGFAELDFVAKGENIVFVGPTGVGKTGLATGLVLKALQNGYRALFVRAQDLFDEMYASLADRSSRKLLNRLSRVDLLCIDEMGYLNRRPEQTNSSQAHGGATAALPHSPLTSLRECITSGTRRWVDALLSRLRHMPHVRTRPTCATLRAEPWAATDHAGACPPDDLVHAPEWPPIVLEGPSTLASSL